MTCCVVFDFDGTLVLSNQIKRDGFFAAVSDFVDGLDRMARILDDPPGDRYAIFQRFVETAGGDANVLATRYSAWCHKRILIGPERQGASMVLAQLSNERVSMHVNSATPAEPLRALILHRYGKGGVSGVHGGHGSKRKNLEAILRQEQLRPSSVVTVGDGVDNRDAASLVGCRFVGVGSGTLAAISPNENLLDSLEDLWALIWNGDAEEIRA